MNLNKLRESNYLSPAALRQAIKDIVDLDQANQLADAKRECALVLGEEYQLYQARTGRQEMSVSAYADIASKLLGINRQACEQAAFDILFPNQAATMAKVLRAWARDIGKSSRRVG